MTGGKSGTCLLCVNEGDVKQILINVERSSVLMTWGSCRKHSNADKANMVFAFYKPLILFRVAGGWSLSLHALG